MRSTIKSFYLKSSFLIDPFLKRCPKTGRVVGLRCDAQISRLLFPVFGLLAVLWFLIRVIPKPSRAAYPCQRIALGIGSSFLAYAIVFLSSFSLIRYIRKNYTRSMVVAFLFLSVALGGIAAVITDSLQAEPAAVVLTSPEGPNQPMGEARGIHPGRVVWVQDFDAATWNEKDGLWWDDGNTDQQTVDAMFSQSLQALTGKNTDAEAWDALFRHHNQTEGRGDSGYQEGEIITIKLNCNTDGDPSKRGEKKGHASTQVVYTLVKQLIEQAGVRGEDIILTDPSRHIGDPIYDKIRSNPHKDFQQVVFAGKSKLDKPQYIYAEPDMNCPIYFDMPDGSVETLYFPEVFTKATYMINAALLRPHSIFGVTMIGKNHFGSIFDGKSYMPASLHAFAVLNNASPNKHGDSHCHPSLLGHKVIDDKTFLYLLDGLYTSHTQTGDIVRWSTMGDNWFSSLLLSQDPIALDSVGYDFVLSEPNLVQNNRCFNGNVDSYLHECALAGNPPSGALYDPEHDGVKLTSLGVHEHWNNAIDKQYSRNLNQGKGIELIAFPDKINKN
ncbi:MAG: DUF362 domain-containing protein [Candidatus Hinthialibacter sp.]